ncbi:MAG: beta-CASP ribonuclease aCPSF1 [Candidatus Nanohaloarchaeota archaeon QJJ-7]|nr:beta-CASP ribonuclease aCPSF1 [Candidatus Nanohaloarchaeota archaeon QJJ-7]
MADSLDELIEELPDNAMIKDARYEASDIVFYTGNREFFLDNDDVIRDMVSRVKKRIEVRPDPSITNDQDAAEEAIKEIVPEDAGVDQIIFEEPFGKVVIRAEKPGLVIGKNGSTLDKIKEETYWMPEVDRVPAIDSKIVDRAREIMTEGVEFRKEFLHDVGKKIELEKDVGDEWIRVEGLGGFRQVGRSSVLVQTEESNVLMDAGVDTSRQGRDAYPHLDVPELDLKDLDAVIATHAHMDHVGLIPYLYEYGYEGPVYCTEPTRDMMVLLQLDYLDVARKEGGKAPYDSSAIKEEVKRTITVDYGEVTDITPDMRLTFNNAGHILGSASAHLHIGEGLHNIVYTGDIKYDQTKLLRPADPKFNRVETLILESTYGGKKDKMPRRDEANKDFVKKAKETLENGGKLIIPVFAIGRSQEIMMILAEEAEKDWFDFPVYLDGMIWDATALHTAYPEFLSKDLQNKIFHEDENPFLIDNFHRIGSHDERENVYEEGPAVILATSGMMTGGPILSYVENLAEEKDNRLIFVGYQAPGSLGSRIQSGERSVELPNGKEVDINMQIDTVTGFSAHSDRQQLINYVGNLPNKPQKIITNHGEKSVSFDLSSSLHKIYDVDTEAPPNLESIRLN